MKKRILIVCRQAPYGNTLAKEAIDMALAASAFEQSLALLFLGDGIYQLLRHQDSQAISQKNHERLLSVLPLYDISTIYVDKSALTTRQLSTDDLLLDTILLRDEELLTLNQQFDVVINF